MAPTLKAAAIHAPAASGPRRAVFIDVENTSSEADLLRVLDDLHIDLSGGRTEVTAVGNWRVIGQQLGRTLAHRGAQLVHSAPAPRVSDWSDLWIAVSAGMWLGRAAPGDVIDIVSDDRAFDAIGDAAVRIGVRFRRTTYRTGGTVATSAETAVEPSGRRRGGRRRGGRRRGGRSSAAEVAATPSAPPAWTAPPRAHTPLEEPHAASQDHIRAIIARLTAAQPERGVSLDMLVTALKAEGFQRPPGSPRLITRLRRLKDVEVLPNGRVRLIGGAAEIASAALAAAENTTLPEASIPASEGNGMPATLASAAQDGRGAAEGASSNAPAAKRRRSKRRGGRRGGARRRRSKAAAPQ